jgi:ribosomal-protein-alanine N-acetyltransferase
MEKLGMRRNPIDDFEYPSVAEGSPLRTHVLYRLAAHTWTVGRPEAT